VVCFFFFYLFPSPNLSGRRLDVYLTSTQWCGPSANLERMSEMCFTRLAGNTGHKNSPFWYHRTTLSGCIFGTKACIDNRKNLLNSNTSSTHVGNMVNVGLLTAEICWEFGHPCKFQRVSRLGIITARHCSNGRQANFAALNRGRHLYSAGRPSRWALAHISSSYLF